MTKILKIQGPIEPDMLENLARQIEEQEINTGDMVDVCFDSVGGAVDIGFAIANVFEQMQEAGIEMRAVAEGKVYSSAIVPFLSIENRVAIKGASFLVHKATYDNLTNVDKDKLRELQTEIEAYTDIMYDFYDDHGITREVRTYLKEGDGITLDKPNDMIDAGFVSKVVNERTRIYNRLMRGIDRIFPSSPNFSYIINSHQIQQNIMTNKQIKGLVAEAIKEAMPELIRGVATVVNEMAADPDEEPMNEAVAMSPEKLGKLEGVMFETPATVEGSDEVKYLAHPTKAVEKDHFVVPIAEDGSVVRLPEGDHTVTVDGKEYTIHSTGDEWYIHNAGPANEDPGTEQAPSTETEIENEDTEDETAEKKPEEEPEVEDKGNPKPVNKRTAAPKPNTQRAPVVNKNTHAAEMHRMFADYGPGCVGNK